MAPVAVQQGTTDLLRLPAVPDPSVDAYTVHTYFFCFSVPAAGIGVYAYLRCQPALGLGQGGVSVYRGLDNLSLLDADHHDYRATMPWPAVDGGRIAVDNGLVIDVADPGRRIGLTYASPDGRTGFDVWQEAVTPLVARGHVADIDGGAGTPGDPGGSEQLMRCTGTLRVAGEEHAVDCHTFRDRSWAQVRREDPEGRRHVPPLGWTGVWFAGAYGLSAMSYEPADSDPAWLAVNEVPPGSPHHISGWAWRDGALHALTDVRRVVHERHPLLHAATRQELSATDSGGHEYRFTGTAIAMAPVHSWPNIEIRDSVVRWTDTATGAVTHAGYQEGWYGPYQRAMKARRGG
jgi:hypothetical protein